MQDAVDVELDGGDAMSSPAVAMTVIVPLTVAPGVGLDDRRVEGRATVDLEHNDARGAGVDDQLQRWSSSRNPAIRLSCAPTSSPRPSLSSNSWPPVA